METIFFERSAILEYLKKYSNSYADYNKHNELISAVVMSALYSAGTTDNTDAPIGFMVKRDFYNRLDADAEMTVDDLEEIFQLHTENDTPIDIIISHLPSEKITLKNMSDKNSWSFQVKRFIEKEGVNPTDAMIDYLNIIIKRKYGAKIPSTLLLLPEVATKLDLPRIADSFDASNFPFKDIQFIFFDFKGDNDICFGSIFPERTMYKGKLDNILNFKS